MNLPALLTALLLAASPSPGKVPASPEAPPKPPQHEPVILFLIDNSASLPPLDPEEQRVQALEKLFTFIQGRVYRLVLFGGRSEIYVDDVTHYNNKGQWTDFYSAFVRVKDVMAEYPADTAFRIIMVTDGLIDPNPKEWLDDPPPEGQDLRGYASQKLLALLAELKTPLYVIMVGDVTADAVDTGAGEQAPPLVLEMTEAANGGAASIRAQRLSGFFHDDGLLVKKFIFRVAPQEGLQKVVPVVQRIVKPPNPSVELKLFSVLLLPLFLFLALLLGIVVRSFPGPGDLEVIELTEGLPLHLAVDRVRKTKEGVSTTGLSLLSDARDATGTITWQRPSVELTGVGLSTDDSDALAQQLLPLSLTDLRRRLESLPDSGTKDEKIYALNLDYMAKNLDPGQAEKLLVAPLSERRRVPVVDFLRAKAHLVFNDELRRKLTEPRAQYVGYGRDAERKELTPRSAVRIGRYRFLVKELVPGGRKDVRVVLYYDHVPSLLGLKRWLPDFFQRVFRLRRSQQRIVS